MLNRFGFRHLSI